MDYSEIRNSNPFHATSYMDALSARVSTQRYSAHSNPFQTPTSSSLYSPNPQSARSDVLSVPRRRFRSSRLTGTYEQPWREKKDRRKIWDPIFFYGGILIGLGISGFICYREWYRVPRHEYCLVLEDHFSTLDPNTWGHEVQVGGFGASSFDWTTTDASNSYVDGEGLHIMPTLTTETTNITADEIYSGYTLNLTADGTCTGTPSSSNESLATSACFINSNETFGRIINPIRSARLTTAGKYSIKYGRVEVVAKLPLGDWIWPAIWMMPEDSVYGDWPRSGEIDIAESRGNDAETYPTGNNQVGSAIHWGTSSLNDQFHSTQRSWVAKRTKYGYAFHTFALEWSEDYLLMWLDGRLQQVFSFSFAKYKNLWTLGKFAGTTVNNTTPDDPWSQTGRKNTPFDEKFYLILNVAVGATNGYFIDGVGGKPWGDNTHTAMRDFYNANKTWLATWPDDASRGMTVKSVKMWQQGACGTSS